MATLYMIHRAIGINVSDPGTSRWDWSLRSNRVAGPRPVLQRIRALMCDKGHIVIDPPQKKLSTFKAPRKGVVECFFGKTKWRGLGNDRPIQKSIEPLCVGKMIKDRLRLLSGNEPLVLDPTDCLGTLGEATDVFKYIDSNFRRWSCGVAGPPTTGHSHSDLRNGVFSGKPAYESGSLSYAGSAPTRQ